MFASRVEKEAMCVCERACVSVCDCVFVIAVGVCDLVIDASDVCFCGWDCGCVRVCLCVFVVTVGVCDLVRVYKGQMCVFVDGSVVACVSVFVWLTDSVEVCLSIWEAERRECVP